MCCNRNSVNRCRQKRHEIVTDAKCNEINDINDINFNEEIDENLAMSNGFNNINDEELLEIEFSSNLCKETNNHRDFARHVQHETKKNV